MLAIVMGKHEMEVHSAYFSRRKFSFDLCVCRELQVDFPHDDLKTLLFPKRSLYHFKMDAIPTSKTPG